MPPQAVLLLERSTGLKIATTLYVETGVLLHELKECAVKGKVGSWLASFLDSSAWTSPVPYPYKEHCQRSVL